MRPSVLRCVWLAAVALSATGATGCQSDEGAPHVAPGTPVGKVVDVAGQVTATRDGKTRTLTPGEDVSPDDVVATADTGSVSIELFHNRANLQLQNGAASRIDDSLAWELTKSDVEKLPGGKVMVSAGRHGEHSAAQSATSAVRTREELPAGAATTSAPRPSATIGQPITGGVPGPIVANDLEQDRKTKRNEKAGTATGNGAPKPPATIIPPGDKDPLSRKANEPTSPTTPPPPPPHSGGSGQGGGSEPPKPPDTSEEGRRQPNGKSTTTDKSRRSEPEKEDASSLIDTRVEAVRAKLESCLKGDVKHLTITVTVTAGKLTFGFAETNAETARACVQGVLKQVDVKNADGTTSIEISL